MLTPSTVGRIEPLLKFKGGLVRNGRRFPGWAPMVRRLGVYAGAAVAKLRVLAPYALIIVVVPGGALMALLILLYRRQRKATVSAAR